MRQHGGVIRPTGRKLIHSQSNALGKQDDGQGMRKPGTNGLHRAFIGLGSNIGDRVVAIEQACREMNQRDINVVRTSSLWETEAMYVVDQDPFLNGVCEVETVLSPEKLLDELQAVENSMGRTKLIDKGPRNIDLDIVLYGSETVQIPRLQIPHKLMTEREFVLRPLSELIPHQILPGIKPATSVRDWLSKLTQGASSLSTITPLSPAQPAIKALLPTRSSRLMAILNVTPDSFSDGGLHENLDPEAIKAVVSDFIAAGATIIDIGGQSTRPGAEDVGEKQELDRVLPAVRAIRSLPEGKDVCISIDTYRARVAREAVQAGADMINDISGGLMDENMLPSVADLGSTICLMHTRGTPATMKSLAHYPDGIITTVGRELCERVHAAESAGIPRWRIILDPGIGFAKTQEHNLELLGRMDELRNYSGLEGLPWLLGPSRKSFIGRITGVEAASERTWGTATAVSAAVAGGADILRVHDVKEMSQVAKMADAIWRRQT
ncbi:MAG: hypothetical protein M4579_004108 [Chaenotheca gracillima]|nr:MAG: hypothetical protein M4579_004108 [Chaenotheca gracillima]